MEPLTTIFYPFLAVFRFIHEHIFYFYAVGFSLSLYFLFWIAYYATKSNYIGMRVNEVVDTVRAKSIAQRRILRAWNTIKQRVRTGDEAQCKLALVEADRLLNDVLTMAGLPGRNLDERLATMDSSQLPHYDEVCEAHRLSMRAVSDTTLSLTASEAEAVILIYKKAFRDLGLIREI